MFDESIADLQNILNLVDVFLNLSTLLTLLRILLLGRIGSISYVLPIRQNINILNRDIRVLTTSIGVPAETQIQELFCSSVNFDHKISISVENMIECLIFDFNPKGYLPINIS